MTAYLIVTISSVFLPYISDSFRLQCMFVNKNLEYFDPLSLLDTVACQFLNTRENRSYFILINLKKKKRKRKVPKNYKRQTDCFLCQQEFL